MSVRADAEKWDRASHEQETVLSALQASVRAPAEGQTLFVFRAPARAAAGIPIFAEAWDLDGAARIIYDEPSIAAYPIFGRVRMVCSRRSVFPFTESSTGPDSDPWGPAQGAAYGKAVFVDVQNRRAEEISNRSECQMARRRFKPGPLYLSH